MLGLSTFVAILVYYFEFYTSLDRCNTSHVDCTLFYTHPFFKL
jgi:hypothetical protein